jgi:hypothetical protein
MQVSLFVEMEGVLIEVERRPKRKREAENAGWILFFFLNFGGTG